MNLSDGLDGLAGGTTLLCCAVLALLAWPTQQVFVGTMAVVLMGCVMGFLRYNTWPARVFMGDAGSQLLGFSAGVLALMLTQDEQTVLSSALPLLLLGLPIIDTISVMTLRLREGRSPFVADRKHLHHKLLALGFDHYEAVVVIYLLQSLLILAAWQLRFESDLLILAVFAAFAGLITGALLVAERTGWRWRVRSASSPPSSPKRLRLWLADARRLPNWTLLATLLCTGGYILAVAAIADRVATPDIAWLAAGMFVLLLAALAATAFGVISALLERPMQAALYISGVLAIYLDHTMNAVSPLLQSAKWILLPTLAVAVMLRLRLSGERRFQVTPLDALLLIVALVLPNLPGLTESASNLGLSLAKLVVLLYAVELLFNESPRTRTALAVVTITFLGIVAMRNFAYP
jgi:UDP-GlcNAc:undecaprenyl-phosphate GlcNAc-1-phosphate transferase